MKNVCVISTFQGTLDDAKKLNDEILNKFPGMVEELLKKERTDVSGAVTPGANLSDEQASRIIEFLQVKDLNEVKKQIDNEKTQEGIKELEDLFEILKYGQYADQVKFDPSKIRGLDVFCY